MAKIDQIIARAIYNSRALPTIETYVVLDDGTVAKSSVPTGSLTNTFEAKELWDNDQHKFSGKGVNRAVDAVNNIITPKIVGMDASLQQEIDNTMIKLDSTHTKEKLGSNSILSVSQAVCKASARSQQLALSFYIKKFTSIAGQAYKFPTPMFNMVEGGKHADGNLDFQEFLVIPASYHSLADSLELGIVVYNSLRNFIKDNNLSILTADEGGFAPLLTTNADAFRLLKNVFETTQYSYLRDIFMGADMAANNIKANKKYHVKDKKGQLDPEDLMEIYNALIEDYSLVYIEDPFADDDWDAWKQMFKVNSSKSLISGDELICTNPFRLQEALNHNTLNSVVIKPNQIGTLTEAIAVAEIARYKNLKIITSARSGETEDDFIADFAVAIGSDYVKFGAPAKDRISKYNRLLTVEQELLNHEPF